MHNDPTEFLTSEQACAELGIDRSALHRRVRRGVIAATKLNGLRGAYLFTRAEIERVKAAAQAA